MLLVIISGLDHSLEHQWDIHVEFSSGQPEKYGYGIAEGDLN